MAHPAIGEWKCWWADMRQIFVITEVVDNNLDSSSEVEDKEKGDQDRLKVVIHDYEIRPGGGTEAIVTSSIEDPILKFRILKDESNRDGFYAEYTINWDEEPVRMTLQDIDAEGESYNNEWGWVTEASGPFEPH